MATHDFFCMYIMLHTDGEHVLPSVSYSGYCDHSQASGINFHSDEYINDGNPVFCQFRTKNTTEHDSITGSSELVIMLQVEYDEGSDDPLIPTLGNVNSPLTDDFLNNYDILTHNLDEVVDSDIVTSVSTWINNNIDPSVQDDVNGVLNSCARGAGIDGVPALTRKQTTKVMARMASNNLYPISEAYMQSILDRVGIPYSDPLTETDKDNAYDIIVQSNLSA